MEIAPVPGRRTLVIANAALPGPHLLGPLVRECRPIVATDGGANHARRAGIALDAILGDLDSLDPESRSHFGEDLLVALPDPGAADLEKTVALLFERKHREITIVGISGGRLDHTLGNLSVLARYGPLADVVALDDDFEIRYVLGTWIFEAPIGTLVSLVATSPAAGITTEGLRYPLVDAKLDFSTLGIHNEVAASPVRVTVPEGGVFLFRAHGPAPPG